MVSFHLLAASRNYLIDQNELMLGINFQRIWKKIEAIIKSINSNVTFGNGVTLVVVPPRGRWGGGDGMWSPRCHNFLSNGAEAGPTPVTVHDNYATAMHIPMSNSLMSWTRLWSALQVSSTFYVFFFTFFFLNKSYTYLYIWPVLNICKYELLRHFIGNAIFVCLMT